MRRPHAGSFTAVLLQPDMIRIFIASLFILGQVLVSFSLIPLFIVHRGGGTFAVGLQTTVFAVSSVVLRFFFGPLADIRGRRSVLALGAFVFATANPAILLAPNLTVMTLVRVYQAIGMASYLSAASSLVADLAPAEHRGAAIGAYRVILPVAALVGPFLGNDIINRFGFTAFFIAMGSLAAVSFLLILSLKGGRRDPLISPAVITPGEIFALFRESELRSAYAAILTISVGGGIITTFVTTYGSSYFSNAAIYFVVYAIVGATAAIVLGRLSDRIGRTRLVIPILLAITGGIAFLYALEHAPLPIFFLSAALTGIGFNAGLSVFIAWIVDATRNEVRATALSLQESWIDGGFAVGIFLFGTLSAQFGMKTMFLATGILLLISTVIIGIMARNQHREIGYEHIT
jgi:predicted MFS family arabinose efflux permease